MPLYTPEAFHELSRLWVTTGWALKYPYTFSWMGRPVIQLPEDMITVQEVIYRVKPDVIVETGVAHGGSLVFSASLCRAMGRGRVIGVDIEIRPHNRSAIEAHELFDLITLVEGSSVAPEVVAEVRDQIGPDETVLVILDSNHSYAHVAAELEAYAPLVTAGSYIVATDGVMEWRGGRAPGEPGWSTDNPKQAAADWQAANPDFVLEDPPPFVVQREPAERAHHPLAGFVPCAVAEPRSPGRSGDGQHPVEGHLGPLGHLGIDGDRLTTRPSTRFSSTQARWGASMRNMVEHGQISGSSDTIVLSGVSASRRCTRWISVATAMVEPAGAASTAWMMKSVEPTWSASSHTSWAHSGWAMTMPSGCSARKASTWAGPEALVDRAVALPQQEGGLLGLDVVEAAQVEAGVPHPHVGLGEAHLVAGVAAQVLVGEEQHLAPAGAAVGRGRRRPTRARPGRWSRCTPRRRARPRTP